MNITLNPHSYMQAKPKHVNPATFTSNYQTIGKLRPHCTYFFRDDLEWGSFARYLNLHFKNTDKVNIYNAACSDGTEPFTLVMTLLTTLGKEKSEKFFPIEAFDLNTRLVKKAKTGEIHFLPGLYGVIDFLNLKFRTLFGDTRFLSYKKQKHGGFGVKMNDDVRRMVNFRVGNVISKVRNIEGENTVFLCRNMWMYLTEAERIKLAEKLGQNLKKNSVVVLGQYDLSNSNARKLLLKNGFEETYVDKVYEKMV